MKYSQTAEAVFCRRNAKPYSVQQLKESRQNLLFLARPTRGGISEQSSSSSAPLELGVPFLYVLFGLSIRAHASTSGQVQYFRRIDSALLKVFC